MNTIDRLFEFLATFQIRLNRKRPLASLACSLLILGLAALSCAPCLGQQVAVLLKNGMVIRPVSGQVIDSFRGKSVPNNAGPVAGNIAQMDDGLRMTFVDNGLVQSQDIVDRPTKIEFPDNNRLAITSGEPIVAFTASSSAFPFTRLGRRYYQFNNGTLFVQGITSITAQYIQLKTLKGTPDSSPWDMRMSLDSLAPDVLREILLKNTDPNRVQSYLDIVKLYQEAGRPLEAREVLAQTLQLFPSESNLKSSLKQFEQNAADQILKVAQKAKRVAGQRDFAKQVLSSFDPSLLSLETGLEVQQQREQFDRENQDRDKWLAAIKEDISQLKDHAAQTECQEIVREMDAYLNPDPEIMKRLTDYIRLRDSSTHEKRVALAIGGWIYGPGFDSDNLSLVLSGIRARRLVQQYLSAPSPNDSLIDELSKLESGTPQFVSRIVAYMPPPMPPSDESLYPISYVPDPTKPDVTAQTKVPGRYYINVPLPREMAGFNAGYLVQLPPEYNPYRRYPCIVTMNGQVSTPEDQVNWWCGTIDPTTSRGWGEASKNGYIVVAPVWLVPKQPSYNYTENEHAYVISALLDAKRRFSIDNDRVFLSGHHIGGDGAWDIALAHPDLWAGCVVICGVAAKYVVQYLPNTEYVPHYFVTGELAAKGTVQHWDYNSMVWDKMLRSRKNDVMVTVYRGRGFDHFQEELPRIFEWLNLSSHVRNFKPGKFAVKTSRFGDRFFWWFETDQLKEGKNITHPLEYEAGTEHIVESEIRKDPNNVIFFSAVPADRFSVLLNPDLIYMDRPIEIKFKGTSKRIEPKPDIRFLLQDVRARCDRQHPFWMKISLPK